jgi:hypothetical protein
MYYTLLVFVHFFWLVRNEELRLSVRLTICSNSRNAELIFIKLDIVEFHKYLLTHAKFG